MGTKAQVSPSSKPAPCIARQPILTASENVLGYELFFRESAQQNNFTSADAEKATAAAIDMLNVMGLDVLCNGRLAFINCTRQTLLSDYFALLPPGAVVIEIQHTVPPDEDVIRACQRLKHAGYSIALDNFEPEDKRVSLVAYADYLKVDIAKIAPGPSALLAAAYGNERCQMLAQKVETRERFLQAQKNGFTAFQGYFFQRPVSLQVREIPANQATYMRLLSAVSKVDINFAEVEGLIKHEPSLCYKLLRYLNSPLLGLSSPVLSVRHALGLLGEQEAVKWIRMATTLIMGHDKCSDLVLSSLVRARFCELIGAKVEHGKGDLFLLGMLSLMDSILAAPMGVVLDGLGVEPDIKAQLLRGKTGPKTPLSAVYDLMLAREAGDWTQVIRLGKELNVSLSFVAEKSNEAMRWAHEITSAASG